MVNQYLTKHIGKFKENVAKQEAIEKAKKQAQEKAAAERAAKEAEKKTEEVADDSQCVEVSAEEAALIEAQEAAKKANPAAATEVER